MYKIGKTKDVLARQKQLQTSNVDDIIILHTRSTSDDFLLEKIVHYVLDSYRYKSNREYFTAKLDYIKIIIDIAEVFLDTLKSSYEHITKDELLHKININIDNQLIENIEFNSIPIIEPINKLKKKIIIPINNDILPITDNFINDHFIQDNFIQDNIIQNNNPIIIQQNNPIIQDNNLSTNLNIQNYSSLKYGSKNSYRTIRTCQLCNTVLNMSDSELYKHQLTYKCTKLRKNTNTYN